MVALPSLLVVTGVAVMSRGQTWAGEWAWSIDWANGSTLLAGPIAAAITAFEVNRLAGPQWRQTARQTLRPNSMTAQVVLCVWGCACVAWLIGSAIVLALSASHGAQGAIPFMALGFGPITLLAYVAIGAAIGVALPSLAAAPIAAVTSFGLAYLGASGIIPGIFRTGGVTGTLVGQTWDRRVASMTVLVLLALAGALLAWVLARGSVMRSTLLSVGGVVMAITTVAGLGDLSIRGDERFVPISAVVDLTCQGTVTKTCLAKTTSSALPGLAKLMDEQAQTLIDAGARIPERYIQEIPGQRLDLNSGLIVLPTQLVNKADTDAYAVADYLSMPAPCPAYFGEHPPDVALEGMAVLAAWIRVNGNVPGANPPGDDPLGRWLATDPSGQRAWVVQTFDQLSSCKLESVRLPFASS
jgi:hypothetical protein